MPKKKPIEWLEFESPWTLDPGIVRVPKPAEDVTAEALAQGAYRNQTARPYIVEDTLQRRLHFTHDATQSAMLIDEPDALVTPYTRKMMSFLLFNPNPRRILMIGLGGGSLPKFCYRQLPETEITVVEINADVIAMRDEFCLPQDDARFRIVHDDGAHYMERLQEPVDVILVDAFDADGIALSLANSGFYSRAAAQLTAEGVLVMNFWGQSRRYVDNIRAIRAAFRKHVVLVPVTSGENLLLFALKRAPPESITDELESLARRLQSRLQLEFPRYLRRICQGQSLGLAR